MVLFGGLEIVAAGYLLNELHKDDKSAQRSSSQQPPRRRKHRDSSSHHRPPHQPRPPQQHLLPPQPIGPPRPSSAPPQQYGPPRINSAPPHQQGPPQPGPHLGPAWMHPSQPFSQPPQAQTWHPQPQQPPQQQPHHQPPPQHRPSGPVNSAYAGTVNNSAPMYFDTRTGKWQSGMLPPGMPRSNSDGTRETNGGSRHHERSRRQKSYSSGSGSSSSDSEDSELAYGKMPGHKSHNYTRDGPEAPPPYSEREHDWYATQQNHQLQPGLGRGNRAATVSAAELSGASAPRPGYVELDAETPGRYRAYRKS